MVVDKAAGGRASHSVATLLLTLLWRSFLAGLGFDLEESGEHNEELVNVVPLVLVKHMISVDRIVRGLIFVH